MRNLYNSKPAKITRITPQTETIKLFRFEFAQKYWGHDFSFNPGQFIELSLPGFGEAPFAPCQAPNSKYLELCVRDTGRLTHKLHEMKEGEKVGIRGPYGNGWPIEIEKIRNPKSEIRNDKNKRNILIVVGGLGLIPLRTLIIGKDNFFGQGAKIQIFYGAKAPNEMLFRYEFAKWRESGINVQLTVDKECPNWVGCVGMVPALLDKNEVDKESLALLCGPPVMYQSVLKKLKEKGIDDANIFVSLERRMHCGVGVCQHCAIGPFYTCKDGPVFCYEQIKSIPGAI